MVNLPRIMLAAPSSGSGKSIITSGLMAALSQRMIVQGFKVGPDYIDPMYHTAACGRPSRNLDTWMVPPQTVRQIFLRSAQDADIAIIEGVMGLFDGYSGQGLRGSSAEVALLLGSPVILVIDCAKQAGSAAAVVYGFHHYHPDTRLAGVICNRVGGKNHALWLRQAIANTGVPVLGCIPFIEALKVPERHLGLFTVAERESAARQVIDLAATTVQEFIDLDQFWQIASQVPPLPAESGLTHTPRQTPGGKPVRLAIARDEAFCFYYEDNLDALRHAGAEIVFFSPLRDANLPEDISGIYIGGGYPELYARTLGANHAMIEGIVAYNQMGTPIYAECGGLMYLTMHFREANDSYPMVGLLPGWCEMGERLNMGYREVETIRTTLLNEPGEILRGHEFHYSRWENPQTDNSIYRIIPRNGDNPVSFEGYGNNHLQASYVHLHFDQNASLAPKFVASCIKWRENHAGKKQP